MTTKEEAAAQEEMAALLAAAQQASPLDASVLTFDGDVLTPAQVNHILGPHLTDERKARIEGVLDGRTYTLATVVEGLTNTGNVSAVMRTAEALGVQPFHIITNQQLFKRSARTTQGSDKWLDVWQWATPADACRYLKQQGYRIIATHLDADAKPIEAFDFTQKTALVFGNELAGVSPDLLAHADATCILPMTGFVQSYNISVAAAIALYHAYHDRLTRQRHHGDLSDEQRTFLRASFFVRATRHAHDLIREARSRGTIHPGP